MYIVRIRLVQKIIVNQLYGRVRLANLKKLTYCTMFVLQYITYRSLAYFGKRVAPDPVPIFIVGWAGDERFMVRI